MAETSTSSVPQPEKPTDTTDDDAKQSPRIAQQSSLCAEESYEQARKRQKRPTTQHSKEDEESNDDRKLPVGFTLQPLTHVSTHVKIRGAISGMRYALPGVGNALKGLVVSGITAMASRKLR